MDLRPGDRLIVLASGVLEARLPDEAAFQRVTADGTPVPAPAASNFPAPGLETLSLLARVGNQAFALRDGIKIVAPTLAARVSDDFIFLDVNAPPRTEYAPRTGWSVYVVKATAAETPTRLRNWTSFRDLTTVATPTGGAIAAVVMDDVIHVFWAQKSTRYADLNHLTIEADGTIGPTDTVESFAVDFGQISALVHRGELNVFYCGQRGPGAVLCRAVLNPAGAWDVYEIDGSQSPSTAGSIRGRVGLFNDAVSVGNTLHVLYNADSLIDGTSLEDLRQASVTMSGPEVPGAPYIWLASTIDGAGGASGRVLGNTAGSVTAMLDVASQVHAFYFLGALTGGTAGFDLRHSELNWTGADSQAWRFETIDGAGRTFPNATGQLRGRVGLGTGCVLHDGALNVAYNDITHDNLRHGVKPQGSPWSFETLDGNARYEREGRFGTTNNAVRRSSKALVSLGDQISIFYDDQTGNVLRHAFKRKGLPWLFEIIDGDVAYGGRVRGETGRPAAVVRDGFLNLIYYDVSRKRLRHAVLSR